VVRSGVLVQIVDDFLHRRAVHLLGLFGQFVTLLLVALGIGADRVLGRPAGGVAALVLVLA
jgi:hypothetical protein